MSTDIARPEGSVVHAAAVYNSDAELRARATPFLQAGLDRGEAVLAIVPASVEQVLRSDLGGDDDRVRWQEPGLSDQCLGEAFDTFRGFFADRHAAGEPARLLTQNDLDGDPDRLAAYLRLEAVSTESFAPFAYTWACLYDQRRHPPDMLASVGQVHPQLIADDGGLVPSTSHVDPIAYLQSHPGPVSPIPEPAQLDVELTAPADLPATRHRLRTDAAEMGMDRHEVDSMLIAVTEVLTNALQHGRAPCRIRAWGTNHVLHVRVDDHGHSPALAAAGYWRPTSPSSDPMGLWVARQLADVVHTETSPNGTTVELQFRGSLPPARAMPR
jgi:anti-sigma regulatory factor (Ser/Thr protein kinase)